MLKPEAGDRLVSVRSTLVIYDHPLYCDALATTIEELYRSCMVHSVNSLKDELGALAGGLVPDLVMLDLKLPDVTGLGGFVTLRERLPDVPILVISAESLDETIQVLMDAGAAGFVPKDAACAEIANALCRVQDGLKYLPPG